MYLIYGAFTAACFIYGGLIVSSALTSMSAADPDPPFLMQTQAAFVLGAIMAIFWGFAYRRFHKLDDSSAQNYLNSGKTLMIIQCAFFEGVALLGLVGVLYGMSRALGLLFVFAALVCLVLYYSSVARHVERYRALLRSEQS